MEFNKMFNKYIAVVLLIAGVLAYGFGCYEVYQADQVGTVEGKIHQKYEEEDVKTGAKHGRATARYTVDGVEYIGELKYYYSGWNIGERVSVNYLKEDPSIIVSNLKDSYNMQKKAGMDKLVGCILIVVGLAAGGVKLVWYIEDKKEERALRAYNTNRVR